MSVKTARYCLPLSAVAVVNDSVVEVAPPMLLKVAPLSVETCHCTVWSLALLVAATVNVTGEVAQIVCVTGCVVTTGVVSTVRIAALVVLEPQTSVKTARYCLPLSPVAVVNDSVVDVAPPMLLNVVPLSVETCHCTVWSLALLVAATVKVTGEVAQMVWVAGRVVMAGSVSTVRIAADAVLDPQASVK